MLRRTAAHLKNVSNSSTSTSSMGSKLARGIAIGGLCGGLAGLAIEIAPEEYGLREKADQLLKKGSSQFENLSSTFGFAPKAEKSDLTSTKPSAPLEVPKKEKESKPLHEEEVKIPAPIVSETDDVVVAPSPYAESEVHVEPSHVPLSHEPVPERHVEEPSASPEPQSLVDTNISSVEEEVSTEVSSDEGERRVAEDVHVEAEVQSEPVHDTRDELIQALREENARLHQSLEITQAEYRTDMAHAAGATQATLDTLDRLYKERETAITAAKQGIVVNELLYSMALDQTSGTSGGALRVMFNKSLPQMVESCFRRSSNESFVQFLLARVLAKLYSTSAGVRLLPLSIDSPTWSNLRAVQEAMLAVERGDFVTAVDCMEKCDSSVGSEWVEKAKQSLYIWQSAEAAVGSLHDELSKVL